MCSTMCKKNDFKTHFRSKKNNKSVENLSAHKVQEKPNAHKSFFDINSNDRHIYHFSVTVFKFPLNQTKVEL